jgi:PDGLE domain
MRRFTILALAVAILLGAALSPLASSSPDGLERVAAEQGFADRGRTAPVQQRAPVRGYAFPGVDDARLATGLAGLAGALGVFVLGAGLVAALRRPRAA